MDPVPVVRIKRHTSAASPTVLEKWLKRRSSIVKRYTATMPTMPEYNTTFHANTDVGLKLVAATITRSGRPRSSISTIRPPMSKAMLNSPDKGAHGL